MEIAPEIKCTSLFMLFILKKTMIINNFVFKDSIQQTTHDITIQIMGLLIESVKAYLLAEKRKKEFIFNIYDLLRCKIKRNTPE
jgi:hypothetical protein